MKRVACGEIRRGIRDLGLTGHPVCLHSSLRSLGHVEGGADTVVDAFLEEGCTLLVPAFSWAFRVAPPSEMRPLRNGSDYERLPEMPPGERRIYTPSTGEIDPTMGAVARAVVDRSGRSRGEHPLNSFAAVGPDSEALVGTQAPLDVYAPLGILADRGGFALLIGVGLTTMTLLHLAEVRAGREPFRRWANAPSGDVIEVQTGGCSGGFDAFEPLLARRTRETLVGESRWRAYAARETIEDAVVAIQLNPQITHCGNLTCERCRDAVVGGPLVAT